jgi:hypothetical protein
VLVPPSAILLVLLTVALIAVAVVAVVVVVSRVGLSTTANMGIEAAIIARKAILTIPLALLVMVQILFIIVNAVLSQVVIIAIVRQ